MLLFRGWSLLQFVACSVALKLPASTLSWVHNHAWYSWGKLQLRPVIYMIIVCCMLSTASVNVVNSQEYSDRMKVGVSREGYAATPINQLLTPYGQQVDLPGLRPQSLALSPDGKLLVTSGKTSEIVVLDPTSGKIKQRVQFPGETQLLPPTDEAAVNHQKPDTSALVSYTGMKFAHDGRRLFVSNVQGSIKVFEVKENHEVAPLYTIPLPQANAPRRAEEIPSGLALSSTGDKLYVCGNLSNQLLEIDVKSNQVLRKFPVGVAPYDVVINRDVAYVSNWGGSLPQADDLTGPAGRGTIVKVDPVRFIANEGSVSVINLQAGTLIAEVKTGLHASALVVSPDKQFVVCANAGSDTLSLIHTETNQVTETIWTKSSPAEIIGASPNALALDSVNQRLYVANGTQNAIAVFHFEPEDKGDTKLLGMIPAGWFPGALVFDSLQRRLYVANIKGLPKRPKLNGKVLGYNTHHYYGSLSLMNLPEDQLLPSLAERVSRNMRLEKMLEAKLPPRENIPARPIPERIGEPSLIKHVVYIIKENRTYDQVFGELKSGNGDPDLCIFGEEITPNIHKLAQEFVLLENTYCAGILSADGHQWSTTAFSTDYMEKSFADFPRSYPDGMGIDDVDALAYSPAGFLWDNAILHKKTLRNYGEFMIPEVTYRDSTKTGNPDFMSCYRTWKKQTNEVIFKSRPGIESIRPYSPTDYIGWNMSVPDQYRADFILNELKQYTTQGEFPNLVLICLPNDHTSGTAENCPTPAACMADNDLALGRIVEGLSHSPFWKDMAIFVIEDDPQNGWDHVSGYRTTAQCISPYAKRGVTVSTLYNTTCVIRTIEQILGLPPMNQFDASATVMFDCFTDQPLATPYNSVVNKIPLDQLNPAPVSIQDPILKKDAEISATLNFREIDKAPEDTLNRILWRSMNGSQKAYPEWAITLQADDDD